MNDNLERLKIDMEPRKLRIESEPYVKFLGRQYCPVINVYDIKRRREYFIVISAMSLSQRLEAMKENGRLKNLEIWINKQSEERSSKYELEYA